MRTFLRFTVIFRLIGAFAGLWLFGAAPTWAGDGGSVGTLQDFLGPPNAASGFCQLLGINPCPQVPTLTQLALEISALVNSPPDLVRSPAGPSPSAGGGLKLCTPAGNTIAGLTLPVCNQANAINAVNPPAPAPIAPSELSSLVPLAFTPPTIAVPSQAVPVILGTSGASSFFYAATTAASGQPGTLSLFYDYPPLTTATFVKGQVVATLSLPLVTLNNKGVEQAVPTTVQLAATCTGGTACLTATATGNFFGNGTQTRSLSSLGVQFALVYGISPNSSSQHAIFELRVPLIVTGPTDVSACQAAINLGQADVQDCGNDPAYFGVVPFGGTDAAVGSPTFVNQASGFPTAFFTSELGTPVNGVNMGIAPYPAPLGSNTTTFGFCASFLANDKNIHPAVATFLAIGTDGTTYVSTPIPPKGAANPLACPF